MNGIPPRTSKTSRRLGVLVTYITSSIFKAQGSCVSSTRSRGILILNSSDMRGFEEDLANGLVALREDEAEEDGGMGDDMAAMVG